MVVFFGRDSTARFRLGAEREAEWAEFPTPQKKMRDTRKYIVDSITSNS